MFGDFFSTPEDLLSKDQPTNTLSTPYKARNCAYSLDLPPLKREKTHFAGLRNQGATCYLNSLFQTLYMSPEFRTEILNLPLCNENVEQLSNFVDSTKKHSLLFAFQKLFAEMKELDLRAVSTEDVTKSFGWNNNQETHQQDIQEALRVIFDYLERALFGTNLHDCISKNYQGMLVNHISCLKCGTVKERTEAFYDIMIQVKNFSHVEDSLMNFITPEKLEGSNKYFCEVCNSKEDALKGVKIRKFPKLLIFSLNRFFFDYETMDRTKINDNFAFSLEFNCNAYQETPNLDPSDSEYELAAVILHRGDAYHGHYHAYIRDVLGESNWEEMMKLFDEKREEIKRKTLHDSENNKQSTKIEENLNKMELESKKKSQEEVDLLTENSLHVEPNEKNNKKNKKQKKEKKDKKSDKSEKKKQKDKKEKTEFLRDEFFDELEFPIPFKNSNLAKNWFDFNDSCVTAISVNRLQKQYGGSNENAYLLVYRQKNLKNEVTSLIPEYLQKVIIVQNEVFEKERQAYKDAEKHIEICLINSQDVNINTLELVKSDPEENKMKVNVDEKFEQILSKLAYEKMTDLQQIKLVEVYQHGNKLLQFKRILNFDQKNLKIQELELDHLGIFLVLRNEETELLSYVSNHFGIDAVPIKINLFFGSKNYTILSYLNSPLSVLKSQISKLLDLDQTQFFLRLMQEEASVLLNSNSSDDFKSLKELKFSTGCDILINIDDLEDIEDHEDNNKNDENQFEDQNLKSVLLERDDSDELNRFFVSLNWTLAELFKYLNEKLNLDEKVHRRLRKLKGNSLFYEEELTKTLKELEFEEGGIRLRLERGPLPKFGNFALKILIQSTELADLPENKNISKNIVSTPMTTIQELLKEVCGTLNLDPEKHKLYKTDWLEEPIEAIAKVDKSLHMNSIKTNDILVLRDVNNLIPKEILKFCINLTKTGKSDDSEYLDAIQIKEDDNLISLKKKILSMPQMKAFSGINVRRLRVREIKKDLFFGRILRNEEKALRKFNIKSYSLACQVLEEEENLDEDDIVLMLRKRSIPTRTYEDYFEKIFHASKEPKIAELKNFVLDEFQLQCSIDEIELAKYISHEFNWLHFHLKYFEEVGKRKKTGKKKRRGGKNKGNNKNEKIKNIENIKKSPYLLNDGDIIGYRLEAENIELNDDFQTFEDDELKMKFKELKTIPICPGRNKNNDGVGFQILVDF